VHVDRLALNQLRDRGGAYGQESEESEEGEEEREEEEEVAFSDALYLC
jgi:hypothetical protein